MKKIGLPLLLVLFFAACKKQITNTPDPAANPASTSPVFYGLEGQIGTEDNSALLSYDNNLIICGTNHIGQAMLIKSSKSGNEIWRKEFAIGGIQGEINSVAEASSHELFMCGSVTRNVNGQMLLVKANSNGDTLWTKTYGRPDMDYGRQVIKTADGNILMCGTTDDPNDSSSDIFLIKVNTNGDTLWTRSYHDPDQEVPFSLKQTQNGDFIVTGTNEDSGPREIYILRVNNNGNKLWDKKIGPADWKWGMSITELTNTDLVVCGRHTSGGYNQILVIKTDANGNVQWEREFGATGASNEEASAVKQNADGSISVTGMMQNLPAQKVDAFLLKLDQNGNQISFNHFGGTEGEWGTNLLKDSNDDNIIIGSTYTFGPNAYMGNIFITTR